MGESQLSGWDAGPAPRADPLAYPGRWPPQSILLTRESHFPLALTRQRRLGQAWVTLELLGVGSGAEIVIEGRADDTGEVEQIRLKAFPTPEWVQQHREDIHGGDFSVRYPSARDALGVHPDIPWIYIDTSARWMLRLGTQRLGTVRVRPSRSFQLRQELREMMLILGIAFIGLVEVVTETWARIATLVGMLVVVAAAVSVRMRGRLSTRVIRPRKRRAASRRT